MPRNHHSHIQYLQYIIWLHISLFNLGFSVLPFAQYLVFCVPFCVSLLVLFLLAIIYCLSFDLRLLIILVVSENSSLFKISYFFGTRLLNYHWILNSHVLSKWIIFTLIYFGKLMKIFEQRNKSWKPECVGSFNMDWRILVFYPEPEARDKI
jgi:hypothetical protein